MGFETSLPWIHIPTDSYCVTLGKLFNSSGLCFPPPWNRYDACLTGRQNGERNGTSRMLTPHLAHQFPSFLTPCTIARQAPLSMGFSRPEYWSGLPCPPLRDLPNPGVKPRSPLCRRILYCLSHQGSPRILEWVAYPFSRGSFWPRNWARVSFIVGGFFTNWAMREAQIRVSHI